MCPLAEIYSDWWEAVRACKDLLVSPVQWQIRRLFGSLCNSSLQARWNRRNVVMIILQLNSSQCVFAQWAFTEQSSYYVPLSVCPTQYCFYHQLVPGEHFILCVNVSDLPVIIIILRWINCLLASFKALKLTLHYEISRNNIKIVLKLSNIYYCKRYKTRHL